MLALLVTLAVQPPPPPFEARTEVTEASLLVSAPSDRQGIPDADGLRLLLAERPHPITAVTDVGGERWPVTVYLDAPLLEAPLARRSLGALALEAATLTAIGPVEVFAGERGGGLRQVTRPTGEARRVLWDLADLAWEPPGVPAGEIEGTRRPVDSPETVRERLEAIEDLTAPCPEPACVLVWISGGWGRDPAAADAEREQVEALARRLTIHRWLVVPVAIFPTPNDPGAAPREMDYERWRTAVPPSEADLVPAAGAGRPNRELPLPALEAMLDLRLAPLRQLADLTGGELVLLREQLAPRLTELTARRRVWYVVPREGPPAATVDLRRLRDGRRLDTPRWGHASLAAALPGATDRDPAPTEEGER